MFTAINLRLEIASTDAADAVQYKAFSCGARVGYISLWHHLITAAISSRLARDRGRKRGGGALWPFYAQWVRDRVANYPSDLKYKVEI